MRRLCHLGRSSSSSLLQISTSVAAVAGGARHSLSAAEKRGHSSTERRWGVDWRDAKRHFFPLSFSPPSDLFLSVLECPDPSFLSCPPFFTPLPLLCHRRFFPFETLPLPALFSGHHRGPSPNSVPSASSVAAPPLFRIGGRPQKAFLLLSLFTSSSSSWVEMPTSPKSVPLRSPPFAPSAPPGSTGLWRRYFSFLSLPRLQPSPHDDAEWVLMDGATTATGDSGGGGMGDSN